MDSRLEIATVEATGGGSIEGQSIRRSRRWIIILCLLIAAAVLTGVALLIETSRTRTIADTERNLHSLALVLSDQVERSFQSLTVVQNSAAQRLQAAGVTSSDALRLVASTQEWHDNLKAWVETASNIHALTIVDGNGNLVSTSGVWPTPAANVEDRDYFKAAKSDPTLAVFVGQPVVNKGTGAWTVFVSQPLIAPEGQFIGIIAASFLLSDLERFYHSISNVDEMAIALFRRDGTLLARYPRVDRALGKADFAQGRVFSSLNTSSEVILQAKSLVDGVDRYVAAKALDDFPLVVSVTNTVRSSMSAWKRQSIEIAVVALMMIAAVLVAGFLGLSRLLATERLVRTAASLARQDTLTGLPNRLCFNENLASASAGFRRSGGRFAILILDLDQFKEVNDTLGHAVGDDLLKAVAVRLHSSIPLGQTISRLGGDQFAIIQADVEAKDEVEKLAAHLIDVFAAPFHICNNQITVGVSVGAALLPESGVEPDRLLRSADLALDRAKASGRRVFRLFSDEMEAQISARRAIESDLRRAVADDAFELVYQPLLNLRSNRISGFEALLRWNHPDRGNVPPGEFIPVAEDIGLIGTLGEWVLRKACGQATAWPPGIKVSVNLSPVQFRTRDLVADVTGALRSTQLPASRLELEITESVVLEDNRSSGDILRQISNLGVSIALDDFGTGYASLRYLRQFPFNKIKIDQSFVQEIEKSKDCAAIVSTTLMLANRLGMTTTAEGVETVEQRDTLRSQGCTEAQGYLISRPIRADDILPFLSKYGSHLEAVA